jgi:hypothetical protein
MAPCAPPHRMAPCAPCEPQHGTASHSIAPCADCSTSDLTAHVSSTAVCAGLTPSCTPCAGFLEWKPHTCATLLLLWRSERR